MVRPGLRVPLLGMALITCVGRVAVGAHFLSDAVAGAGLGCLAYRLAYDWARRADAARPAAPVAAGPT